MPRKGLSKHAAETAVEDWLAAGLPVQECVKYVLKHPEVAAVLRGMCTMCVLHLLGILFIIVASGRARLLSNTQNM